MRFVPSFDSSQRSHSLRLPFRLLRYSIWSKHYQCSQCKITNSKYYHCLYRPSTIDHRPSTINHQPSTIDHRPSTIDHRPSTIDHRPSTYLWQTKYRHICGLPRYSECCIIATFSLLSENYSSTKHFDLSWY